MRKASKASGPFKVSITKDGKQFEGEYHTNRGAVIVRYGGRQKSATFGASALVMARLLLRELVDKGPL